MRRLTDHLRSPEGRTHTVDPAAPKAAPDALHGQAAGIAAALQEAEEIRRTHTRRLEDRGRGRPGNAPAPGA
ncbi:hypothetical protein [Streptomyces bikiniensis]|uniref:hypothetical protein n=1 Tax=Streptomyces bikiniensis TaxID=1896 RepID=UPI0004C1DBD2|nr:hypothetical protein [Streptomyces bikiniensis]